MKERLTAYFLRARWGLNAGLGLAVVGLGFLVVACSDPDSLVVTETQTSSGSSSATAARLNKPPTFGEGAALRLGGLLFEVSPTAAKGSSVGRPLPDPSSIGSDEDGSEDDLTYVLAKLDGSDEENFAVSAQNSIVVAADNLDLSDWTGPYLFELHLFDGNDRSSGSFTVFLVVEADGNSIPFFVAEAGGTVPVPDNEPINLGQFAENDYSRVALVLGGVHAYDADKTDTLTYSIDSLGANSQLSLDSFRTGPLANAPRSVEISFREVLDYENEAHKTNTINMTVSDGNGGRDTIMVQFELTNVNEAPTLESTNALIEEGADGSLTPVVVTNLQVVDPENDAIRYVLSAAARADDFVVDANTGQLSYTGGPVIRTSAKTNYLLGLSISDNGTPSKTNQYTLEIIINRSGNRAPEIGGHHTQSASLDEGDYVTTPAAGLNLLTISAADPDGDDITFSIQSGNEENLFALTSSGNSATLNAIGVLDHETQARYRFVIRAEETTGGALDEVTVIVNVRNVNEKPSLAANAATQLSSLSLTVDEVARQNTVVGRLPALSVFASDPEQNSLSYKLYKNGSEDTHFKVDGVEIKVKEASLALAVADSPYEVDVKVADNELETDTSVPLRITIRSGDRPPVLTATAQDILLMSIGNRATIEQGAIMNTAVVTLPAITSAIATDDGGNTAYALYKYGTTEVDPYFEIDSDGLTIKVRGDVPTIPLTEAGNGGYLLSLRINDGVQDSEEQLIIPIRITAPVVTQEPSGDDPVALNNVPYTKEDRAGGNLRRLTLFFDRGKTIKRSEILYRDDGVTLESWTNFHLSTGTKSEVYVYNNNGLYESFNSYDGQENLRDTVGYTYHPTGELHVKTISIDGNPFRKETWRVNGRLQFLERYFKQATLTQWAVGKGFTGFESGNYTYTNGELWNRAEYYDRDPRTIKQYLRYSPQSVGARHVKSQEDYETNGDYTEISFNEAGEQEPRKYEYVASTKIATSTTYYDRGHTKRKYVHVYETEPTTPTPGYTYETLSKTYYKENGDEYDPILEALPNMVVSMRALKDDYDDADIGSDVGTHFDNQDITSVGDLIRQVVEYGLYPANDANGDGVTGDRIGRQYGDRYFRGDKISHRQIRRIRHYTVSEVRTVDGVSTFNWGVDGSDKKYYMWHEDEYNGHADFILTNEETTNKLFTRRKSYYKPWRRLNTEMRNAMRAYMETPITNNDRWDSTAGTWNDDNELGIQEYTLPSVDLLTHEHVLSQDQRTDFLDGSYKIKYERDWTFTRYEENDPSTPWTWGYRHTGYYDRNDELYVNADGSAIKFVYRRHGRLGYKQLWHNHPSTEAGYFKYYDADVDGNPRLRSKVLRRTDGTKEVSYMYNDSHSNEEDLDMSSNVDYKFNHHTDGSISEIIDLHSDSANIRQKKYYNVGRATFRLPDRVNTKDLRRSVQRDYQHNIRPDKVEYFKNDDDNTLDFTIVHSASDVTEWTEHYDSANAEVSRANVFGSSTMDRKTEYYDKTINGHWVRKTIYIYGSFPEPPNLGASSTAQQQQDHRIATWVANKLNSELNGTDGDWRHYRLRKKTNYVLTTGGTPLDETSYATPEELETAIMAADGLLQTTVETYTYSATETGDGSGTPYSYTLTGPETNTVTNDTAVDLSP